MLFLYVYFCMCMFVDFFFLGQHLDDSVTRRPESQIFLMTLQLKFIKDCL